MTVDALRLAFPRKVLASDVFELTSDRIGNLLVFELLERRFVILRTLMEDVLLEQVNRCIIATKSARNTTVTGGGCYLYQERLTVEPLRHGADSEYDKSYSPSFFSPA
jgi:hypothetical protein